MPLRGIETDNVAIEITQDPNSVRHYVSFEFYPFHEGMTFAIYKGLMSSDARLGRTFCVVKTLMDRELNVRYLNDAVNRANEAQRLATKFNSIVGYEAITFQLPYLAQVKRISDFIGLFRCFVPHEKRLVKDESVIIEDFVEGDFVIFNTSNGTVPNSNPAVNQKQFKGKKSKLTNKMEQRDAIHEITKDNNSFPVGSNNLAQAFCHFTWHETQRLVVCDLKGAFSQDSYSLSNPTIHSLHSNFGPCDRGPAAIAEVFAAHRCTNICRDWSQYTTPGSNTKNQINFCQQSTPDQILVAVSSKSNKNICTHENNIAA